MKKIQAVYALYVDQEIIYVGKTGNLIERLIQHNTDRTYSEVKFLPIENKSDLSIYELYYITTLKPVQNRQDVFFDPLTLNITDANKHKLVSINNFNVLPEIITHAITESSLSSLQQILTLIKFMSIMNTDYKVNKEQNSLIYHNFNISNMGTNSALVTLNEQGFLSLEDNTYTLDIVKSEHFLKLFLSRRNLVKELTALFSIDYVELIKTAIGRTKFKELPKFQIINHDRAMRFVHSLNKFYITGLEIECHGNYPTMYYEKQLSTTKSIKEFWKIYDDQPNISETTVDILIKYLNGAK